MTGNYRLMLQNANAISAFESIRALIDKDLSHARKAKARREDRKAHPEKYPPRRCGNTRKAGALELPSGHVIVVGLCRVRLLLHQKRQNNVFPYDRHGRSSRKQSEFCPKI